MRSCKWVALAALVMLVSIAAAPARAADKAPLNAYEVRATAGNLEQLALAGYDVTEGGSRADGTIEVYATRGQAAGLRRDGIRARQVTSMSAVSADPEDYTGSDAAFDVWTRYDRVDGDGKEQYLEQYDRVVAEHPDIVKQVVAGQSVFGREIVALKVTKDANTTPDGSRPAVLHSALQHAREWLAGETCRRTLDYFVENYGQDTDDGDIVTPLVDSRELWFMCVANPDGYEYTFTPGNRLWRKNMADNDGDGIHGEINDGVDPNRNFPTNWGRDDEGSNYGGESETYRGPAPGSEPETQTMRNLWSMADFEFQKNDHTAAELLLWPFGYQLYTQSPDEAIFQALAGTDAEPAIADKTFNATDEVWEITGNRFDPDIGAELYTTNGETNDDAYQAFGILGYTPEGTEAEGAGLSGFEFPDDEAEIEAEFQRHRLFSLDLAASAGDPENPVSHMGNTVQDFYVDAFPVSYGDPQPVQATVKRSLGPVKLRYRINDGNVRTAPTNEYTGGENHYTETGVYYHRVRGEVQGTNPGDSVEVWFENASGSRSSSHFTYTAQRESGAPVLILSAENYTGTSPPQDPTGPRYLSFYTDALDAGGVGYDVYDVDRHGNAAPDQLGVLSHYQAVIWYTGDDFLTRGPDQPAGTGTLRLAVQEQIEVRDYLNEGGKLFYTGKNAGQQYSDGFEFRNFGFPEPQEGGEYCNRNGTEVLPEFDEDDPSQADGCILHSNDFLQYWLGAYVYVSGGNSSDPDTGQLYDMSGDSGQPFDGMTWSFDDTGAANQDHSATFAVTSSLLDPALYPRYADSRSMASWLRPGAAPFSPYTGQYYMAANYHDAAYKRLRKTIDLTGAGSGQLDFRLSYDLEVDYDYVFVEVHTLDGTPDDDWTTLPDANGNTSSDVGLSCPSTGDGSDWQADHPFLARYQTKIDGGNDCDPTGSTGEWNGATGNSGGWTDWSIDLSDYAGQQIEVSITVATDPAVQGLGLWLDDARITKDGAVTEETSFETDDLGGWQVGPPPAGTDNPECGWTRSVQQFTEGGVVGTDDTVYTGFGFEGIGGATTRAEFMKRVLGHLGVSAAGGPGGGPGAGPGTGPGADDGPNARAALVGKRRLRMDRRGRVRIRVRCVGEAGSRCTGVARLNGRLPQASRTFGRKRFSIAAGRTSTVRVKLGKATRRKLRQTRRLRATLRVAGTDSAGARFGASRRVLLLAPRRR